MKKYSRILIIANLILLLGYFNWSVYQKEQTLKEGQLVLLQLAPVDPRRRRAGDRPRPGPARHPRPGAPSAAARRLYEA